MNKELLETYSDYLISSFSYATATGLSGMLDGAISHDKITRFLATEAFDAKSLWQTVKSLVRKYERDEGVLIVDDTIEEKPYTDESELVCWHYDHSKGRTVKGINIVNVLYQTKQIRLPVNYTLVEKELWVWDKKKQKEVRKSAKTKNEHMRDMLKACAQNQIKFRYVLADIWYGSAENMNFIAKELKRFFLIPLKANRKVALSLADKENGLYQAVGELDLEHGSVTTIYVEGLDFSLQLTKLIFKNEDDSGAVVYLVTNDLTLDADQMAALYQRRWGVEEFHASIKGNTSLAASPTKTKQSQKNHAFASIYAFVKLEGLRVETKLNHFALRTKLYIKALQASFHELNRLKALAGLA
jgi:hypothetical protein